MNSAANFTLSSDHTNAKTLKNFKLGETPRKGIQHINYVSASCFIISNGETRNI